MILASFFWVSITIVAGVSCAFGFMGSVLAT